MGIDDWSFESLFMSDFFSNWIRDDLNGLVVDWSRRVIDIAGSCVRFVAFGISFAAESNFSNWSGMINISNLPILASSYRPLLDM